VVVAETPEEVTASVYTYRADLLADAMRRRRPARSSQQPGPHHDSPWLSAVEDQDT
jgi:hypothetical protein